MKATWDAYWYGTVPAVRPYLLLRAFLLLLAFDVWILLLPHAGRYGFGGFNVAHFAWLDAAQPLPSPALYIGVLIISGMLAFVGAMTGDRLSIAALAVLYTYGWAMSLLDAFQHHYLISLFLLGFALLPRLERHDADRRVTAWSFRLFSVTLAIVYLFAAASKYEVGWRSGNALESLASGAPLFKALRDQAATIGISRSRFWMLVSLGVTVTELILAAAYLLATRSTDQERAWLRRLAWVALAAALVLHLEAAFLRLQIGWFSAYMLIAALTFFLPEAWLQRVTLMLTWPARHTPTTLGNWLDRPGATLIAIAIGCVAWVFAGFALQLPGARGAGIVAAAVITFQAVAALGRRRFLSGVRYGFIGAIAAIACLAAVAASSVRFDFYRYLGSNLERSGNLTAALGAFEKAEKFAPGDRTRRARIDELQRRIDSAVAPGKSWEPPSR